jgi:hypothetical protein
MIYNIHEGKLTWMWKTRMAFFRKLSRDEQCTV